MRNSKGQFTKGNGGRPKGSKNRIKGTTREFFGLILKENRTLFNDKLQELADEKPAEFCKVYMDIAGYETPRLRAIEVSGELDTGENLHGHIATKILLELYANRIPENVRKQYESRLRKEIQKND